MTYLIRGGSWGDSPEVTLRATLAFKYDPLTQYRYFGFRLSLRARQSRT